MKKSRFSLLWAAILTAAALAVAVWAAALPGIRRDVREESRAAIRDAVVRAAVECYTVEGAYPATLEYLEENYGLTVNRRDFLVSYEIFASNQMPDVRVLVRGEG